MFHYNIMYFVEYNNSIRRQTKPFAQLPALLKAVTTSTQVFHNNGQIVRAHEYTFNRNIIARFSFEWSNTTNKSVYTHNDKTIYIKKKRVYLFASTTPHFQGHFDKDSIY